MRLNLILFKVEGEKQDEVKSEKKKFPETRQKEYGWREPNELYKNFLVMHDRCSPFTKILNGLLMAATKLKIKI